ncbi:tripartite tricarboxylate transporter substrate binding protein [Belnapia sp. T6]|uniref:Tripartite tricarboxylate transporter substrate binding protein n=1 Tax=Belnapia mucosa TaxID=2804532 RepID=A0ABS1V1F2_9PROT|nr:tripartite tricarboxylate transporter substrate binding protein [Belnapia mucosa]MBL6455495.1 tripartite tricarboxylate transporter substrate binding protein [Belnapia mucosa]
MFQRRHLFAAPALLLAAPARADWPDKPLQMLVAFAAGGGTDLAARTIARFLERDLGQPVVVVNRPGAGGEIGFAELARARPDGLTIGFINTPHIVTLPIERRTRFRLEDFTPIGNIVDDPGAFYVLTDSPFRSLADVIAAARAQPETVSYGTTGIGSDDHLAVLAFERQANIRLLHVPYGGSAQVKQALIGRTIAIASMNVAEGVQESHQGLLRMLGQMGERRTEVAPEVPTFREAGFDVVEGSMRGMAAPAGLPPAVLQRLSEAVQRVVENPEFQASAIQQALPLRFLGPEPYLAELTALREKYQKLWSRHPWRE